MLPGNRFSWTADGKASRGSAALAAVLIACFAQRGSSQKLTAQDVIPYLNRTIAWYEHAMAIDALGTAPESAVFQQSVRQSARQAVQKAFAFARQEAQLSGNTGAPAASAPAGQAQNLERAVNNAKQRVERLEAQIDDLNRQIARSSGRSRTTLISQRDALVAASDLAKEMQKSIGAMAAFASGSQTAGGLLGQINALAETDGIPEALNNTPVAAPAHAPQPFQPQTAGITGLITQSVTLFGIRGQIRSVIRETDNLIAQIDLLRSPLRTQLRNLIGQSDTLASASTDATDPKQLDEARRQIEALSSEFTRLSAASMPVAEQVIALRAARNGLDEWRRALQGETDSVLEYLALRLGSVAVGIAIVLVISRVLQRITMRYVRDPRLQRQVVVLRRVGVGFAVALVAIFGIFGGFGSFATVAGFVTAGLAVALQNVILSVVAYFFLIGRYGLRLGDRVTVSGVNGQVIEVGLTRMYLMELAGAGVDIHPTGRVAVFSNSVIFQPSALIKQAPGTEYSWHAVSTTVAPDVDFEAARARLMRAVEAVYDKYRPEIEQQHENFTRSMNIQVSTPKPVSRIHFTDAGCEILIRYPVELRRAAETDDAILQALFAEAEKEPKLKPVAGGAPKIQAAA